LTNEARNVLGLPKATNEDTLPLSAQEIKVCQDKANLGVTTDEIVKEWKEDLKNNPIGTFEFTGHTPPLSTLDIEELSVKNSRRQDAATLYADLDGFTAYVSNNISGDISAKNVVRALHVLRSELDAVLHDDFAGCKVRFIGDCVHGLAVEGTAQNTSEEETITNLALCAGGMRSSFILALAKLKENGTDASSLGLQIGFEFGPMNITRLGMKGELVRCSVSRGVLAAEAEQGRCRGNETAIGPIAYAKGSDAIRKLFGDARKRSGLDYDTVLNELSEKNDSTARAAKVMASAGLLKPATALSNPFSFPNRPIGPSKPAGFA
jgi:class 3 adenylate cyclase